jgi:CRP-like cAMP-binding protein
MEKTIQAAFPTVYPGIAHLRSIVFFEGLTDEECREILQICTITRVAHGTIIFEEGSFGDQCYVVIKGKVRVSKLIPGVGEEALAVLNPGDYFGEMALLDDFPRSAHAIASTDADLLTISKSDLDELLFFNRDIAYKMLWTFCRTLSARLRDTNARVAFFAQGLRFN